MDNATGWTKEEILAIIDDEHNPDRWCDACDWLESETGEEVDNAPYSHDSIRAAVEAEDVSLLESI